MRWFSHRTKRVILASAGYKVLLSWGLTPQTFRGGGGWGRLPGKTQGKGRWKEGRELMRKQFENNGGAVTRSPRAP